MNADRVVFPLFEFLDGTHQAIAQQLRRLHAAVDAIEFTGLNTDTCGQVRAALDFFRHDARQHHLDEEKHVLPVLLASQDPAIVRVAERLRQDHGWLEENWLQIAPSLEAAAGGKQWFDLPALRHALEVFSALYLDHVLLEESIAYPEAKQRLLTYDRAGMGREMAKRRELAKRQALGAKPNT